VGLETDPKKLIEAAVECVDFDDAPPPLELRIAWDCHRWNTQPEPGGLMDQSYELIHRMDVVENIYNTLTRMRSLVGDQIHNLTESERRLIKWLMDIKVFNG
jgi:hypothetical protein